jgi:endonuclease/exonuclease/phosphatase family metal-dependent hydrolase
MPLPRRLLFTAAVAVALLGACSGDDAADEPDETTAPVEEAAGPDGQFTMLSYNVAGLPQEFSSENPSENLPLISPLLNPFDLVMTQEDFDWWGPEVAELDFVDYHERLRADTDFPYATEAHPGPAAVGIDGTNPRRPLPYVGDGLGFLSRFPMTDVERVPWTSCAGLLDGASDCLAMKGFAVATFELDEGVFVDVYTLHAEAGEGPEDQPVQVENFDQLAAFVTEHSEGHAVILGGDTNLHLEPDHDQREGDTPIWEGFLAATGLTDVCDEVECPEPGAIDKVAYRNEAGLTLLPLSFEHLNETFSDDAGEDLSDHPPVAVEWTWTAES